MGDLAGRVQIHVSASDDGRRVRLQSSRPLTAARLFVGRDAGSAASLVPTLFNLCAAAQASACAQAIEQARGQPTPVPIRRLRARLVAAETVREHLWRILLDWPRALNEPPDESAMGQVIGLCTRWRRALTEGCEPLRPGVVDLVSDCSTGISGDRARVAVQVQEALAGLVAERVLGRAPGVWLAEVGDRAALAAWSERTRTLAARLFDRLMRADQAGLGRCAVPPLPVLERSALAARLGDGSAAAFVAQPTWAGWPHETSPLTRNLYQPLIADLDESLGNGLLTRLAAQLVEVARLLDLADPDDEVPLGGGEASSGQDTGTDAGVGPGVGLGLVPAARGLLVHRIRLAEDRVADYRILAPTEWNFHPQGVVALGLAALVSAGGEDSERLARLFVTAVDPCVAFDLFLAGTRVSPPTNR